MYFIEWEDGTRSKEFYNLTRATELLRRLQTGEKEESIRIGYEVQVLNASPVVIQTHWCVKIKIRYLGSGAYLNRCTGLYQLRKKRKKMSILDLFINYGKICSNCGDVKYGKVCKKCGK